jgi:endonuclease YncB( thermonuclease family)
MRAFRIYFLTALVAGPLAQLGDASSMEVSGKAVIVDGDTLLVGGQEVRLHGIDAAETGQKCQLPKATRDITAVRESQ